ncbi:RNA 2',3'-cyclic phosphodiesterase [Streptosporangium sp. NPDC023615]|uniref:RNA 2',3'-cyclic phosphodiesterase n=1 Tax=Streptosporangium sp. NPDC023615 TaxID=3154794 RepID=UPI003423DB0E
MRLFVGLTPPPPVRDELVRALESSRAWWPVLRRVDPVNWHVTLSFLGEVPDGALPGLRSRLGDAVAGHEPMTLSFTGAGAFPSADGARVFWTGVDGDRSRLARLAASVEDAAQVDHGSRVDRDPRDPHGAGAGLVGSGAGLDGSAGAGAGGKAGRAGASRAGARAGTGRAGRRFTPHLTLARCRPGTDVRGLVEEFAPFSGTAWEAATVHLMRSDAGAALRRGDEVRYESVAQWCLTARAHRGQS